MNNFRTRYYEHVIDTFNSVVRVVTPGGCIYREKKYINLGKHFLAIFLQKNSVTFPFLVEILDHRYVVLKTMNQLTKFFDMDMSFRPGGQFLKS